MLSGFMRGFRGLRGPLDRATMTGAGAGAVWGMASDDTSVIGGALMGAGIGRYGKAAFRYPGGIRRGWNEAGGMYAAGAGIGKIAGSLGTGMFRGATRGAYGQMKSDFAGATLLANQGYAKFKALF